MTIIKESIVCQHHMKKIVCILFVCIGFLTEHTWSQNVFQSHVRPTDPLSPEKQGEAFRLPPGFRIDLVASEPVIAKPMNMAFDRFGRLWVTTSDAYPYAVKDTNENANKVFDRVVILEDEDGDGYAETSHVFADGLNIPMGLYPYKDGVIVYSIPNIYWLRDTDGDNKADKRIPLFQSLGMPRDTHGMQNAFRRGHDGWIYINHGFNNDTRIVPQGSGKGIALNSGNTYRISPDGLRVEQFTWGQVNPFGSDFDRYGFLYTADCHSQPIYQLISGAYYPSFGKPHDGVGFAPQVMQHGHGSTAISGLVVIDDPIWPEEYQNNILVGNVMTSRINRDRMTMNGSSPKAIEMPDLLSTSDPWFRPVDLRWGPDGALYVADFYNRIIGHYEVPLDHPQRDRNRGRIWRISYHGDHENQRWNYQNLNLEDWNTIWNELGHPNKTRRNLTLNFVVDQKASRGRNLFSKILSSPHRDPFSKSLALWGMERLGALSEARLVSAAVDENENVRIQTFHILSERNQLSGNLKRLLELGLNDKNPRVQRFVVRAFQKHLDFQNLSKIVKLFHETPVDDNHLRHQLRRAMFDHLHLISPAQSLKDLGFSMEDQVILHDLLIAINKPQVAEYFVNHQSELKAWNGLRLLSHLARNLPKNKLNQLGLFTADANSELNLLTDQVKAIKQALRIRALSITELPSEIQDWIQNVSIRALQALTKIPSLNYHFVRDDKNPNQSIPWFRQNRFASDKIEAPYFSSLPPGGESFTGSLMSQPFELPNKISFFMAGHRGYPDKQGHEKNCISLVLEKSGKILKKSYPPRNDIAQPYVWALGEYEGQQARIIIHDGDTAGAYAWMAVGRFSNSVPEVDITGPREVEQRISETLDSLVVPVGDSPASYLMTIFERDDFPTTSRLQSATLLLSNKEKSDHFWPALNSDINRGEYHFKFDVMKWLAQRSNNKGLEIISSKFPQMDSLAQSSLSLSLIKHQAGKKLLVDLVVNGHTHRSLINNNTIWNAIHQDLPQSQMKKWQDLRSDVQNQGTSPNYNRQYFDEVISLNGEPASGKKVFTTHCVLCHQKGGEGKLVGPQLDGIKSRGMRRILEDIIDPNGNLDSAFQIHLIELISGEIKEGLYLRDEGESKIYLDASGDSFVVAKEELVEESKLSQSLMPQNFGQILTKQELAHLLSFLETD